MKEWAKVSLLLCIFGFAKELRPSEPYITEFLLGEWRNFTKEEVNREVYPIGTYSTLAQLIIVFLITDFLRYKPIIITIGITGIIVWSMLIWLTTLWSVQLGQVFYGTYIASDVAYYTYIYAKVDKKYYPRVTSHTRAAMFTGKLVAGVSSQILVNLQLMNYFQLNYITLGGQIFATIWAFGLPSVKKSMYFHRDESLAEHIEEPQTNVSTVIIKTETNSINSREVEIANNNSAYKLIWQHFRNAYTNIRVVQWSIWYAIAYCGYLQVGSYIQVLWKEIEPNPSIVWNGAVDAVYTCLAAIAALSAGYIHAGRFTPLISLLVLSILSVCEGGAILLCCWTNSMAWSYVGFVLFGAIYAFLITVASSEVAKYLEEDSYGLIFGINTFVALVLQSLLTLIVVSDSGLGLDARGQFTVYAVYFITIAIIFFIAVTIEYILERRSRTKHLIN